VSVPGVLRRLECGADFVNLALAQKGEREMVAGRRTCITMAGVALLLGVLLLLWRFSRQSALSEAADRTHAGYFNAVKAGTEKMPANGDECEIPPKYWADRIKALHPIRVYTHRGNVVVAQRITGNIEEGKYKCFLMSSYIPRTGDDGFIFTSPPLRGHGPLNFKRSRGEKGKNHTFEVSSEGAPSDEPSM